MDGFHKNITVRTYKPEDIDYIIDRHRELYDEEYNFSPVFGDYVGKYVRIFDSGHDADRERMWIAELDGKNVGVIAIVKADTTTAQLRWFLLEPHVRGHKVGSGLVRMLIAFAREKQYKRIILWTVSTLEPARNLYKHFGFKLIETKPCEWAAGANEECWELIF